MNRISVEQLAGAGYAAKPFAPGHTARNNWGRIGNLRTLYESTLGLIGFGEIGREVALRAAAFGMRVLYTQRTPGSNADERAFGVTYATLDELLTASDFVSVQLPYGDATHHYLDRARLAQLRPDAFLINVARAQLIDRDALLDALRADRLAGFALDPLYASPGRSDDELLTFDTVMMTPHIGAQPRFNALKDFREIITALAS